MKVHFQRLPNEDWICYDTMCTTGDRFVDPAKMNLVTDQLKQVRHWCGNKSYEVYIKTTIQGFSDGEFTGTLNVGPCGKIKSFILADFDNRGYVNNNCRTFTLDLPTFPEFNEYVYTETSEEDVVVPTVESTIQMKLSQLPASPNGSRDYVNQWITK